MDPIDKNIPGQKSGASVDVVSSVVMNSIDDAKKEFAAAKKKLLDVNNWESHSGKGSADFKLYGSDKNPVDRPVQEGDYFRISIPGPDNPSGEGDDWVQVQKITEDEGVNRAVLSVTVKPVSCPLNDDKDVAHFFTEEASSTFIVRYDGNEIFAEVHGRNEKPNIKNVDVSDTIRNTLVATGSVFGFSKIQWEKLTDGLLGKKTE